MIIRMFKMIIWLMCFMLSPILLLAFIFMGFYCGLKYLFTGKENLDIVFIPFDIYLMMPYRIYELLKLK